MLNRLTACVLLATIFYLFVPSNGNQLPTSFKKCELGDSVCLTRTFTDFVQNPKKYPGLKIPKIDPYKQSRPFTVRSFKATPFITVSAYWTNITVYGLDKAICQQISGFQPNQTVSNMFIKVFIPKVIITMNSVADLRVGFLRLKPHAIITSYLDNVVVPMTGKAHVVHRNGKDYIAISNAAVTNQISDFRVQIHHTTQVSRYISALEDGLFRTSWRLFKSIMDPTFNRFICQTLLSVVVPMFNGVSLQEFFNMKPTAKGQ